jgi:hypothetical protein
MQPYPYVAKNQSHSSKQQPQARITRAGPDFGLMELAVGGLHSEPSPIGLLDPLQGAVAYSPGGIQQRFSLMPTPLPLEVAAHHGQVKANLPILKAAQGIPTPATAFALGQHLNTCGPSFCLSSLPPFSGCHDEGLFTPEEIPNPPDAIEAPVHQEQAHLDPEGFDAAQQSLQHLDHLLSFAHPADSQGITPAPEEHISRGIGEEMGGALGGLAAADFLLVLGLDMAMVGDPDQINGNSSSLGTQPLGQKLSQKQVELLLQALEVVQLAGQFAQDGGRRRRSLQLLAGLEAAAKSRTLRRSVTWTLPPRSCKGSWLRIWMASWCTW